MSQRDEKFKAITEQLKNGLRPQPESVRAFLQWFGAQKRGWRVVNRIRSDLEHHGLATSPDFENAYIDGSITFLKAPSTDAQVVDPTVRLSRLAAAHRSPVSVTPDDTVELAITRMLADDFSQLPVITNPREVKGLISWRSIGMRLTLKRACSLVRDCFDEATVLQEDSFLFDAIAAVATKECILVRDVGRTICGIVTATDLNDQFLVLSEPFLLVGEIELGVRSLLHGKFSADEIEAARSPGDDKREVSSLANLSLGECLRLIQDGKHWPRLTLAVDRSDFCARLDHVRELRNDIMHFDPDGIELEDLAFLRDFAQLMRRLRAVGAL